MSEQKLTRLPDGRVIDEETLEWWLRSMNRPVRKIARLSEQDPELMAFERTSRNRRAA